jgi:2,4-dienoyl-CoA reductase-like NADH-dependent reductase (Old Yellow Enzyme family)
MKGESLLNYPILRSVWDESYIAGMKLRNRIIRSATNERLGDELGQPTEQLIRKYEALAKGEAGAIITGFIGVQPNGKAPNGGVLMLDKDENLKSFRCLNERVHEHHTPIIAQLSHAGRQTRSRATGFLPVAPSPIKDRLYTEDIPLEMSEREIDVVINNFALAAERAKEAGFDGVQLHLAHGYLLSSFLTPHMNKRYDQWGGSTENRFQIVDKIMSQTRKLVGDFPILVKINAYEKSRDGIKISEAVKIAKLLEQAGCDAIEVSCGIMEEGFVTPRGEVPSEMILQQHYRLRNIPRILHPIIRTWLKRSQASPEPRLLYNVEHAMEIKRHVQIPIIVVGGIRDLNAITDIIETEKSDYVSMSRPFIIEPNIVKKFRTGKQTKSKCINCNYCMIGIENQPLKCYCGKIS